MTDGPASGEIIQPPPEGRSRRSAMERVERILGPGLRGASYEEGLAAAADAIQGLRDRVDALERRGM